jgi:adenosylcobinamide-phosphate synthase
LNTLDAMVGYRNTRYARFGMAAARADDVANLIPSRLTAALTVLTAPLVEGSPMRATGVWFRDGNQHPSPNSGQCESAMAGALGITLGGSNVYFGRVHHRPLLGEGPSPTADDVRRAARLSAAIGVAALALCVGNTLARPRRRRRRRAT